MSCEHLMYVHFTSCIPGLWEIYEMNFDILEARGIYETKYAKMDKVKFVEDSL